MRRLDDFNLNSRLKAEISSAISNRRLPHAIIIAGGDAEKRVEFAHYLSASYLCADDKDIPCLMCKHCKKIFEQIHPDVQAFEREKDKKEFSVKIVRDNITPNAYIKPNEADGRVFIIKDAETMNVSAQNAFLKILEEPPTGVKFILCCDVATSMLETIRSRATVYALNDVSQDSELKEKATTLAVELSLSLLSTNEYEFMSKTGVFEKDKELFKATLEMMQIVFRDALALKNNAPMLGTDTETSHKLASALGVSNLIRLIGKINELSESINKNANLNLLLTRFSSVLRQSARE